MMDHPRILSGALHRVARCTAWLAASLFAVGAHRSAR